MNVAEDAPSSENDTDFQARASTSDEDSAPEDIDAHKAAAELAKHEGKKSRGKVLSPTTANTQPYKRVKVNDPAPCNSPSAIDVLGNDNSRLDDWRHPSNPSHPDVTMDRPNGTDPSVPTQVCIACEFQRGVHAPGQCPLKRAGVEHCNLCGIPHYGNGNNCPHFHSETQISAMLRDLKDSPESLPLKSRAKKILQGMKGNLVVKKKREHEKRQREAQAILRSNYLAGQGAAKDYATPYIAVGGDPAASFYQSMSFRPGVVQSQKHKLDLLGFSEREKLRLMRMDLAQDVLNQAGQHPERTQAAMQQWHGQAPHDTDPVMMAQAYGVPADNVAQKLTQAEAAVESGRLVEHKFNEKNLSLAWEGVLSPFDARRNKTVVPSQASPSMIVPSQAESPAIVGNGEQPDVMDLT